MIRPRFQDPSNLSYSPPSSSGAGPLASAGKSDSFDDTKKRVGILFNDSVNIPGAIPISPGGTDNPSIGGGSVSVGGSAGGSRTVTARPISTTSGTFIDAAKSVLEAETLEQFWMQKAIREKKAEVEKKIEALMRKHDKDRKVSKKEAASKNFFQDKFVSFPVSFFSFYTVLYCTL